MSFRVFPVTVALVSVLSSLAPLSGNGTAQVITGGAPGCKAVALTFDLCPVRQGSGYDVALIEYLVEHKIPATFFASGRWIEQHDPEVKQLLAVPFFELGTHGQVHAHLATLDEPHQREEILRAVELLNARYHVRAPLFRPPYGEFTDLTVALVKQLGLQFILWNVVSGDPDRSLSADRILVHLTTVIRGGSLVVFHANGKGQRTREVIGVLAEEFLPKQGLKPVTVTDLLSCSAPVKR
jgi:peptidoglycan/xylan/chitin deacetylase (PgdA/CDA1 family)